MSQTGQNEGVDESRRGVEWKISPYDSNMNPGSKRGRSRRRGGRQTCLPVQADSQTVYVPIKKCYNFRKFWKPTQLLDLKLEKVCQNWSSDIFKISRSTNKFPIATGLQQFAQLRPYHGARNAVNVIIPGVYSISCHCSITFNMAFTAHNLPSATNLSIEYFFVQLRRPRLQLHSHKYFAFTSYIASYNQYDVYYKNRKWDHVLRCITKSIISSH